MKKSIRQAVSRGLALLVLLPAAHMAFAGEGSVEYRVAWDSVDSRYRVFVRPTTAPTPDLSMTAQVTLRVPHATGDQKFTVSDIKTKAGTSWSLSSEVFAPTEDTATDYLSFNFTPIDVRAFAFKAGAEQEAFSFKNTGPCLGSVALMNNATDPFNQPPEAPNNSAGTNPGNQFANAGWGTTDDNDYSGNYGNAANCADVVIPTNTAPTAVADQASTTAGKAVTVDVLVNDSDADDDTLTVSTVTPGKNGSVVLQGGKPVYTPNAGFSGTDSFTYTVSDGTDTTTATVNVTVNAVIPPLEASTDAFTIDTANTSSLLDVLANDSVPNAATVTVAIITAPSHGAATVKDNKIIYTPTAGYTGPDTLRYRITDADGNTTEADITLTVKALPTNTAPVAVNDTAETTASSSVIVEVLANDTDADDDTLTVTGVTPGANGTVVLQAGEPMYTPNAGFSGVDSFTYTVSDGQDSAKGTVTVTVTTSSNPGTECATAPTNPQADRAYYRVAWDDTAKRYRVYMYTSNIPSPNALTSAQVTLKVPHVSDGTFEVTDLKSAFSGLMWSNNSSVFAPSENKNVDYLSFTPAISNATAMQWRAGQEIEVFSFANAGACAGDAVLLENATDPFNQPPAAPQNSVGTNPGNSIVNLGWDSSAGEHYAGNYGCPATCTTETAPTDSDSDGLTDKEEAMLKTDPNNADSDADGIKDKQEVGADSGKPRDMDFDGIIDALDKDDDGDGIPTKDERGDANNNTVPDYLEKPDAIPPQQSVSVPTLTEWGQLLLTFLLGAVAMRRYSKLIK